MNTKLVVFDLDGTLVDSGQTIYDATIQTFEMLGIKAKLSKEQLDKHLGAHFQDIFNIYDIHVEDFEYFIEVFKEVYFDFISSTKMYPNVESTIAALHERGIKVALLTTKGQDQAERNLEYFDLAKYFTFIMGRRPGIKVKPDAEPLLFICSELNIPIENTLMVGDTEFDIICARSAGAKCAAVEYGYRTKEKLLELNPDYIIASIEELLQIV